MQPHVHLSCHRAEVKATILSKKLPCLHEDGPGFLSHSLAPSGWHCCAFRVVGTWVVTLVGRGKALQKRA